VCVCVCVSARVACRRMTSTLLMQHLLLDETQSTKSSNRSKITVTHSRDWLIAFVMSRIISKYNTITNNNNEHLYNTALYHLKILQKGLKLPITCFFPSQNNKVIHLFIYSINILLDINNKYFEFCMSNFQINKCQWNINESQKEMKKKDIRKYLKTLEIKPLRFVCRFLRDLYFN